ncbi:protein tamozhennic [Musca vetustissima]|uniref:protein tamozhennic n=1 Tax=Musca vetustissima TaxID=27455 RepID=UPI002AB6021E|nr:protein tamozhennic [Musca vetustissima]
MSDFMPRDILPDLWEEILKRHWTYLETEESIHKLEERKKLEGCLKELLCIVRHDRKFFLPETALVLKNSIRELNDFNAQKAIGAFEAISQYANNLFTKPWRKEFHILKMYSGFFQHEIHSNLIDAEKLFEAMGYRRLSNDTLILDGPICPDQVTNVSRDAMAAYVELQIMKNIYMALNGNNMTTTWLDIFRYREKHIGTICYSYYIFASTNRKKMKSYLIGGISQAVKDLIYVSEEKRYRLREKALAGAGDNYGYIDVQPSPSYVPQPTACQCGNVQYQIHQPPRQRIASNGPCCVHEMQRSHPNAMFGNMNFSNHIHSPAAMGNENISHLPHSRSLEHYSEPASMHQHNMLPHRHSFDHQQKGCTAAGHHQHQNYGQMQRLHHSIQQQQHFYRNPAQNFYESPYECVDDTSMGGGSSISYAAVAASSTGPEIPNSNNSNPYNVSGNRYPLPYNISNQLSAYDKVSSHSALESSSYGPDNHMYAQVSKVPQGYMMNASGNMMGSGVVYAKPMQAPPSEQLIDFDDPPIIPPPPAEQFDPYHQQYQHHDALKAKRSSKVYETDYGQRRDQSCGNNAADMYVYAKPIPKENRQSHKPSTHNSMDKSYSKKPSYNSNERGGGDSTDFSYESGNDDFSNIHRQHSPTQFSKNQDGVGSFESWNYVFKNLERSAYTKNLGDREDLLVKSLHLDSMNITTNDSTTTPSQTSSVEKRRSIHKELENNQTAMPATSKQDVCTSPPNNSYSKQQQKPQIDNKQKMKSTLKQSSLAVSNNTKQQQQQQQTSNSNRKSVNLSKTNDNKSKANNNDNNNSVVGGGGGGRQNKKSSSTTINAVKRGASEAVPAANSATNMPSSTQIIVTGTNEWSCRFCTFINPDSTRICEICCRTKDNNLNASSSGANATQQSVNHTAPTCV